MVLPATPLMSLLSDWIVTLNSLWKSWLHFSKKIVRSDDFYWTVVIFSKTGTRGSHCRLDAVVSCCVQLSPLLCNILWITMKLHNIELYYYKYLLFLYAILNNLNDNCYWNAIFGIKTLKLILIFVSAFHWLSNYALLKPQNLTS